MQISRQHVLRLQKQTPPRFPLRRKIGNVNFWRRDEIEEWIKTMWKPEDKRHGLVPEVVDHYPHLGFVALTSVL